MVDPVRSFMKPPASIAQARDLFGQQELDGSDSADDLRNAKVQLPVIGQNSPSRATGWPNSFREGGPPFEGSNRIGGCREALWLFSGQPGPTYRHPFAVGIRQKPIRQASENPWPTPMVAYQSTGFDDGLP